MRQPSFRNFFKLLPCFLLLVTSLGCVTSGFGQARLDGGPAFIATHPIAIEHARRNQKPSVFGRRDKTSASLATQATPPESSVPAESAPFRPEPLQLTSPSTAVMAPGDVTGDCDYWIVSSRQCDGKYAPCNAGCCLSYFHCPRDQSFCPQGRDAFLASIRPDRPVCFVVHGSYNWWGDVMVESRRIHRWIRSAAPQTPLQVVIFTWPSDGNMPFIFPVDIAILGRRSAAHGAYLASVISQIPVEQRVSIVGHSHGARSTVAALHALGGGAMEQGQALPPGHAVPQHLRAVLLAAAIDHDWLNPGQRYGQALVVPEKVLLMRNSRDATLGIYPLRKGFGERALGRDGLGPNDRFVLGSLSSKIVEMDVASVADWHHGFAHYHERPELAAAIQPYVYFQDAPATVGPVLGPAPVSPTAPMLPARTAPAGPVINESAMARPKARELWIDEPMLPQPRRNAVELGFEK